MEGLCRNSHTLVNIIMNVLLKYMRLLTCGNKSCKVAWSSNIISNKSILEVKGQLVEMNNYNQNERTISIYKWVFLWRETNRQTSVWFWKHCNSTHQGWRAVHSWNKIVDVQESLFIYTIGRLTWIIISFAKVWKE